MAVSAVSRLAYCTKVSRNIQTQLHNFFIKIRPKNVIRRPKRSSVKRGAIGLVRDRRLLSISRTIFFSSGPLGAHGLPPWAPLLVSYVYYINIGLAQAISNRIEYFHTKDIRHILNLQAAYMSRISSEEVIKEANKVLNGPEAEKTYMIAS